MEIKPAYIWAIHNMLGRQTNGIGSGNHMLSQSIVFGTFYSRYFVCLFCMVGDIIKTTSPTWEYITKIVFYVSGFLNRINGKHIGNIMNMCVYIYITNILIWD